MYDMVEKSTHKGRHSRSHSGSSTPLMDGTRTASPGLDSSGSKMSMEEMDDPLSPRSDESEEVEEERMSSEEYIQTLKRLQQHALRVRAHDVERGEKMKEFIFRSNN